ncbi:uncharacterized protein LOC124460774, partial [Drosophila willistoni]|uniref:uncharacterized protein LOC124460774 n=1 Tax=Drosophila willistoni TaxID=7260 RepID=UPI001F07A7B6
KTTASVDHLADAADNATSSNGCKMPAGATAFSRSSLMARTPPTATLSAPTAINLKSLPAFTPAAVVTVEDTPKRCRELSPPADQSEAAPKGQEATKTGLKEQITELGALVDQIAAMVAISAPSQHPTANCGMKDELARMKTVLDGVKTQLESRPRANKPKQKTRPLTFAAVVAKSATPNAAGTRQKAKDREAVTRPSVVLRQSTTQNTSAAESAEGTIPLQKVANKWETVKRPKRKSRRRPDALMVQCSDPANYAKVLEAVQTDPAMLSHKEGVCGVRRTAAGELLLEMKKHDDGGTLVLHKALQQALGDEGRVKLITKAVKLTDETLPEESFPKMRKAYRGTQTATMLLNTNQASKMIAARTVRIGLAECRIRAKIEPRRCYKCLDFGHTSARCRCKKEHEAGSLCFNCGESGHASKDCNNDAKCILCTRYGEKNAAHNTLSRGCPLAAQDLLKQTVIDLGIDIALLSEPYGVKQDAAWAQNNIMGAAIWSCGHSPLQLECVGRHRGYTRAKCNGISIFSCYIAPSVDIDDFAAIIDCIAADARRSPPVIIAGDFNAWAMEWGSVKTTARGRILLDSFASLNVSPLNIGNTQTFSRAGRNSIIDVTFASTSLARNATWIVSDVYTHSDHSAIIFECGGQTTRLVRSKFSLWSQETLSEEAFLFMKNIAQSSAGDAKTQVKRLCISEACDASMIRKRQGGSTRKPVHWWSREIAEARKECLKARRKQQRARGSPSFQRLLDAYKTHRALLNRAIKQSKIPHRWCTARKHRKTLFPERPILQHPVAGAHQETNPGYIISDDEIVLAAKRIKSKTSPGPDGFPAGVIKLIAMNQPSKLTDGFNSCLCQGVFPARWKRQRLVLLPKGGKTDEPSAYRPLCMIDVLGKVFKSIIRNRLEAHIDGRNGLSEHQFGFRKKRSTVNAIHTVTEIAKKAIEGQRWKGGGKDHHSGCPKRIQLSELDVQI